MDIVTVLVKSGDGKTDSQRRLRGGGPAFA